MALPIIGALLPILDKVIDRAIPDPVEKAKLTLELAKLADVENQREHEQLLGQIETNKIEAAHSSTFVAGWRPFIGWGCGAALVYNTLIAPLFGTGVADLSFLQTVLMAILGIGGMRTAEKIKGVATGMAPPAPKANEPIAQPVAPPVQPAPAPKKKKDIWPW